MLSALWCSPQLRVVTLEDARGRGVVVELQELVDVQGVAGASSMAL